MKKIDLSQNMTLINGDSEIVIPTLEDNYFDLCITSPPYNVDLGNNKYNKNPYDLYNDNKDHQEYITWLTSIFCKIYGKMIDGGRVCINVGDGRQGAVPTHSDIIQFMTKEIGFIPITTIVWNKNQVGNRTAWGSYNSPSNPSFPTPFEFIMVFSKKSRSLQREGLTDLEDREFINYSLSLWNIAPERDMKKIGHPAVFPVEIPRRLMKMLSWKKSKVLDPFNGAGSTAVACYETGRKYVGVELSEKYCEITKNRIKNTRPLRELDIFAGEMYE